jgi:hypothetical protein
LLLLVVVCVGVHLKVGAPRSAMARMCKVVVYFGLNGRVYFDDGSANLCVSSMICSHGMREACSYLVASLYLCSRHGHSVLRNDGTKKRSL